MTLLTEAEVTKIARLSKLKLHDKDIDKYADDLSAILDFVAQINTVDTDTIEPMTHPHSAKQRLREDEVTEDDQRELLQQGAPKTEAGLYLVPKVLG